MSELQRRAALKPNLWRNNPVLLQLFGLSPVLAVSSTLINGIGLGVGTWLVLMLSSVTLYHLERYMSETWRFVWYLLILASYTTMLDICMQLFLYPLYRELGIYVPLIACNFALLVHLENQREEASLVTALRQSAVLGASLMLAISLFAAVRELLVSGTVLQNLHLLIPADVQQAPAASLGEFFEFFALQPGAFILLGLLLAARHWLDSRINAANGETTTDIEPAERARVTGKL